MTFIDRFNLVTRFIDPRWAAGGVFVFSRSRVWSPGFLWHLRRIFASAPLFTANDNNPP